MTRVKICGIRELEHARAAAEAGASAIGFVFVPVRREIQPEQAREILETLRSEHERPPAAVGLFVNESAETINRVVETVGLDMVQLHGDEPPELAADINAPVLKALRLESSVSLPETYELVLQYIETCAGVHLDSHVPGQWGGTGVVGDWEVAAQLATEFPVVLAGGLSPINVEDAIRKVRPAFVDVSSGVETDGRKDSRKIREFIDRAFSVDEQPESTSPAAGLFETIDQARDARRSLHTGPRIN